MTLSPASRLLPGGRVYRGLLCCCPVCSGQCFLFGWIRPLGRQDGAEPSPSPGIFPQMTLPTRHLQKPSAEVGPRPGHGFPGTPGPQDGSRGFWCLGGEPRGRPPHREDSPQHRRPSSSDTGEMDASVRSFTRPLINHRGPGNQSLLFPAGHSRVSPVGKASAVPGAARTAQGRPLSLRTGTLHRGAL